jgi:hypothetical protein
VTVESSSKSGRLMLWSKNRLTVMASAPVAGTKVPGGPPVNVIVVVLGPNGVENGAVVMGGNEVMTN